MAAPKLDCVSWQWLWSLSSVNVDGVERTVGDPGVGGPSALGAPKSRFGGLSHG
jgi:hypothetical protein